MVVGCFCAHRKGKGVCLCAGEFVARTCARSDRMAQKHPRKVRFKGGFCGEASQNNLNLAILAAQNRQLDRVAQVSSLPCAATIKGLVLYPFSTSLDTYLVYDQVQRKSSWCLPQLHEISPRTFIPSSACTSKRIER